MQTVCDAARWRQLAAATALTLAASAVHAQADMTTPLEFSVNSSGSASLNVPIKVPPGIAGMEPQLSLSYTSGNGNGLLGWGWMLSGPSYVTRCPKSDLFDGERGAVTFSRGDRYCLDGQRLLLVSATSSDDTYGLPDSEYRTDRDSQARITALGTHGVGLITSPLSWRMETKSGLIMTFGAEANSRVRTNIVERTAADQFINRWALTRIEDRNGNSVEFVYCAGEITGDGAQCNESTQLGWNGSHLLHYIRYTNRAGSPGGSAVVFAYESRPDQPISYHGGSRSIQTQRLKDIHTFVGFSSTAATERGTRVRTYALSYEALTNATGTSIRATRVSRLASIQELGRNNERLPALVFNHTPDLLWGQTTNHASTGTGVIRPPVPSDDCGRVTPPNQIRTLCP